MSKYIYDLSNSKDIDDLTKEFYKLANIFKDNKFKEFVAEKCLRELKDICDYSLIAFEEHSVFDAKVGEYEQNHKKVIGRDYVEIYNSTRLAQDEMFWVSPITRENYPYGISIAKIIEYGTGIKGTSQSDWETNVNGYGTNGWAYYNPDNWGSSNKTESLIFTNGLEGKFIYQKLYDTIIEKFDNWYMEYLKNI